MAFVLKGAGSEMGVEQIGGGHELECIRSGLPFPVYLDLYLYALVNVLGAALVIYPKLEDITILEFERSRI